MSVQNLKRKLKILADAAKYDASCASSGSKRSAKGQLGSTEGMGICHSYTPDGRCISLLKVLYTNFCIYDCQYCVNRVSSDIPRAKFSVEEVVWLTLELYKRNYIEGLFLSSGIFDDSDSTMGDVIEIARQLRQEKGFAGYIHLKAVAGASPELVEKAGWFADRVSANIELPSPADLKELAPAKSHPEIELTMAAIRDKHKEIKADRKKIKSTPIYAPGGQSTQMIVGATKASDRVIIQKADLLYKKQNLRRVYYTAYSPIPDSAALLPSRPPPLVREHRLYQADWLIRLYGFEADELALAENDNLCLEKDPKLAWALANRGYFPVDINTASRRQLLRVPGIGIRNADRILAARRHGKLSAHDLVRLRIAYKRAQYFVTTADDHNATRHLDSSTLEDRLIPPKKMVQPSLFGDDPS